MTARSRQRSGPGANQRARRKEQTASQRRARGGRDGSLQSRAQTGLQVGGARKGPRARAWALGSISQAGALLATSGFWKRGAILCQGSRTRCREQTNGQGRRKGTGERMERAAWMLKRGLTHRQLMGILAVNESANSNRGSAIT